MGLFFKELPTCLKDNGDLVRADEYEAYIKREEVRFMAYLYDHETNKQRIIENETDDLLDSYYDARMAVGEAAKKYGNIAPETQALRGVMFGYQNTAIRIIVRVASRAGVSYSEEFISYWENRAAYFPFGDIMRSVAQESEQADPATSTGQPAAELAVKASTKSSPRNEYSERVRTKIVYELMKRAGMIDQQILDNTQIATFIRAVIGGNPDVEIRRTNCYRYINERLSRKDEATISALFEPFDKKQTRDK